MFKTTIRNILGHKIRLLTTGLAVALGVAFMAGTLVLTATIKQTFQELFADAYAKTDAMVRSESSFEANGLEQRARIDESLVGVLARVEGVRKAQGDVWGYAQVVDRDGEPIGQPGAGPPTIGANWSDEALNTWDLVAGTGPTTDEQVVLDKAVAEEAGYAIGDRITVLVTGAPIQVTVSGIATIGGADSPGGASFVMFTTRAAQEHVGEIGKVDSVSLAASKGVSEEQLVERVRAVLPSGLEAVTGATVTKENQDAMAAALGFFNQFMLVFALVALLVGGFMIFNTFFITVAQRTRQHALLRAVGASKRQVLVSILGEALAIGIVASVVGLAAGVGVAAGLKALLGAFGVDLPAGGVVLGMRTMAVSFSAGVLVTVVAAVSPARKAGKVPPVAAMRDVETSSSGYGSKERVIIGLVVLSAGVASLLYGLLATPSNALAVVGAGALLVFFGVSILGRTVSLPMSRVIGLPLPRLRGISGHLARENAMRNPKRTAATASALMIGVGLVAFITIFAASTKTSFSKTVDRAFTGDFIVTAAGQMGGGGVSPDLTNRLRELPEVETAAGIRAGMAKIDGSVTQILAADRATFDVFDVKPLAGSVDRLGADSIAVFEDVAKREGLKVGDRVPVEFTMTGSQALTVALIYGENQPAGDWLLGVKAFEANYPPASQVDIQVFVKAADGVSSTAALAAVQREADGYPGSKVLDQTEYKEQQLAFVDQMLGLVYALLALAILIALLGIGNTLALSIIERTRELGLLRAVGMTRAQLRSTIRWESVMIAVQGTLLGLLVGIFFGWALVTAMADEGLNTFTLPVVSLAVVVMVAAFAGVVAAILPARRAARMDVLQAVISE
jgi:putative ABC transport system permease protein